MRGNVVAFQTYSDKAVWLVFICVIIGVCYAGACLPLGCPVDLAIFRAAAWAVVTGGNPYEVTLFHDDIAFPYYNPPWTLPILLPLAFFSGLGSKMYLWSLSLLVYSALVVKCRVRKLTAVLALTSAPMVLDLYYGQINFIAWAGLLFPRPVGLILLMTKPQIGFGVAVLWLYEAWCKDRWHGAFKLLWPVGVIVVLSFLPYGFWPATWQRAVVGDERSLLWPWLLPVGGYLLLRALRVKDQSLAVLATPLLSPHVWTHSMVGCLIQLDAYPWVLGVVYGITWIYEVIQVFH